MNHCVPDFETDEDYSIPTSTSSSSLTRLKKSLPIPEGDMMELLWENGQLVMHRQNQVRSTKGSQVQDDVVIPPENSRENQLLEEEEEEGKETSTNHHELFMGEDEMSSWLHYPTISINDDSSFDRQFYADLVYSPPPSSPPSPIPDIRTPSAASRQPMPAPPPRREPFQNFAHFSRRLGSSAARESKVVDSKETPKAVELEESRVSCTGQVSNSPAVGEGGRENELTLTSSPGGSGGSVSASAEPVHIPAAKEDRKRKGREGEEAECQIEDIEFESPDLKKQVHGSTSTKRSRAAEVHNLSERRRRDRINEKMKALQELIPHCNKSDKASMLDEAIEYLKSLQLQVQMMSMGCGMVPMMFPGFQHYVPPMGMGMRMGMEMRMSRPIMPFPSVLAGSALPTSAATAHLGPRFPMQAFHMPAVPLPTPLRIQATNQSDPMLNSIGTQNFNQPQQPNFADAYKQYPGLHQMQVQLPQNQAMMQPSSSSKDVETHENPEPG